MTSIIESNIKCKAKPVERRGRKATDPRFLREATDDSPKDPQDRRVPEVHRTDSLER